MLPVTCCTKYHATRPCGGDATQVARMLTELVPFASSKVACAAQDNVAALCELVVESDRYFCGHDAEVLEGILYIRIAMQLMAHGVGKYRVGHSGTISGNGDTKTEAAIADLVNYMPAWIDEAVMVGAQFGPAALQAERSKGKDEASAERAMVAAEKLGKVVNAATALLIQHYHDA